MALTVILKPSGFQPVGGGKLIYQMTEASIAGKPNYRVQFQFNGYTATIPIIEYRLDSTLTLNADIAPALRTLLQMSETTSLRFLNTYVKYQAVWDGGSDAQVNLNADVIYFYIGNNSILNKRTKFQIDSAGGLFLLPTSQLYAINARTAYLDFLNDSNLTANSFLMVKGQTAAYADIVPLIFDGTVKGLQSASFKPLSNISAQVKGFTTKLLINQSDFTNVRKLYFGSADLGQGFAQVFTGIAGPGYFVVPVSKTGTPTYSTTFKILGTAAGLPNEADVKATVTVDLSQASTSTAILLDFSAFAFVGATVYALQIIPNNDGTSDATNYYSYTVSNASTYAGGSVSNKAAGVWTNDANKDLACNFYVTATQYATINISPADECANPIYLKWLNDLGGISTHLFDYNQVMNIDPKLYGRYKSLQLFAKKLALDQWQMVADLNKEGMDYGDNLKSGQYVRDFTDETTSLPVFVMQKPVSTDTRRRQHQIDLSIRYQLAPNTLM